MSLTAEAHLTLAAEPASIAKGRSALAAFAAQAGACEQTVRAVCLAVSEAITNTVRHAYVDEPAPGEVRVDACVDCLGRGAQLKVSVSDDGPGVLPRSDSPGLGLGLPLICHAATAVDIINHHPGATVCMLFALQG